MTNPAADKAVTQFTAYAVFTRTEPVSDLVATTVAGVIERLAARGVTVRGLYDVAAMPASADLLVWLHGEVPEHLQEAIRSFEREGFAGSAELTWSALGVHRQAEFNKAHAPAFMAGIEPKQWLTVYPFVRSYEWYLLDEDERRELLREHGLLGREFPQVLANTTAAFALGDYEWLLALEADELIDLVDMMRHLRSSGARRHVRLEIPFYTGRRITPDDLPRVLR